MSGSTVLLLVGVLWLAFSLAFFVTFLSRTLLAAHENKTTSLPLISFKARSLLFSMTFIGFFGAAALLGVYEKVREFDGLLIVIGSLLGVWSTYLIYPNTNNSRQK